jgi:hypothetical protein
MVVIMTKDEALRLALEALGWTDEWRPQGLKEEAITAIKAALEAKDEPDHSDELTIAYMSGLHRGKEVAQRTWVGLTDEEIAEALGDEIDSVYMTDFRRVEAKLKEKNT